MEIVALAFLCFLLVYFFVIQLGRCVYSSAAFVHTMLCQPYPYIKLCLIKQDKKLCLNIFKRTPLNMKYTL